MGVAVSPKFLKRGRQDKKVGNHCAKAFTFNLYFITGKEMKEQAKVDCKSIIFNVI